MAEQRSIVSFFSKKRRLEAGDQEIESVGFGDKFLDHFKM